MSTFNELESAVSDKRLTYKQMVEALYDSNPELAKQLFDKVAIPEDSPKVLRKKHRDAQVENFGDDKDSIKTAMSEYDANIRANAPPGEVKPKPKPPVRVWTDEDKVYTKAKNAFVKSKEKEQGDNITLADIKLLRKKWRKEYDAEHKDKKEPVEGEEDDGLIAYCEEEREEPEVNEEQEVVEPVKIKHTKEPEKTKPKLTKEQAARYKVLNKIKSTQTAEERAEYKALKALA